MSRTPASRLLWLLLAVFLVSTAALFAHRALAETTPLALAAWRLGLASLFFLAWSACVPIGAQPNEARPYEWAHAEGRAPQAVPFRLGLAGLCLAGHFLVWFAALQWTPVARATLLVCTTPLWTTLGNVLLGRRRFTPLYWAALALAAFGVWLVTQAAREPATLLTLRGDALATLGGALFAGYLLAVEGLHVQIPARRQVTATYTVAAIVLWGALLTQGRLRLSYSFPVWQAILGMTLGPQIAGHTLLNWSLKHFPSSTVAFSILLEPGIAALLAFVLLHQTVTAGQVVGGVLVLVALALVIAQQSPAERRGEEPIG